MCAWHAAIIIQHSTISKKYQRNCVVVLFLISFLLFTWKWKALNLFSLLHYYSSDYFSFSFSFLFFASSLTKFSQTQSFYVVPSHLHAIISEQKKTEEGEPILGFLTIFTSTIWKFKWIFSWQQLITYQSEKH